jgi:hypothetical protein
VLFWYTNDEVYVEEVLPSRKLANQNMLDELISYCDVFIESHWITITMQWVVSFCCDTNTPPK